jgi:carbohydrate-binding DOMON domain-containing protein
LDTRGIRRFKQLFGAGETFDEQLEGLGVIFRKSLDEVQQEWQRFVLDTPLPEVQIDEPINATKLCYIQDEKGDDKGDGDYTYPKNERALPGIFDMAGLKISTDQEMVYFQLEFANMSRVEISSDEAFNGTFAAIALDSDDKKNSGNTRLFFDNGNFEFAGQDGYEFVIEVSNAGVLVYDKDWVWQALFLKAFSPQSHVGEDQVYFAVPRKILGTPDSSWKFQVLVGGQRGGHKDFGRGVGKFLQVGVQASTDQGGGGTDTVFDPDVYDILTRQGEDQTQILGGYEAAEKRKAIIPLIRLTEE